MSTNKAVAIPNLAEELSGGEISRSRSDEHSASLFDPCLRKTDHRRSALDPTNRSRNPPLPDTPLVRRIIRQRELRARFFGRDLFADPAWDMLLDLAAAQAENKRVSVSSLCIASRVPPTTALRWIGLLIDAGLFERTEDETDRRRAFIALTERGAEAMARYFDAMNRESSILSRSRS